LTIRNSKLTLTDCCIQSARDSSLQHCLSVAIAPPLQNSESGRRRTMLWSEKTTVCRIFSCQRSDGGQAPKPPARSLVGPQSPTPLPRRRSSSVGMSGARGSTTRCRRNLFKELADVLGLP